MKEIILKDGGRYVYLDDLVNLQELALSITHLLDGCGDFIMSGCEISKNNMSAGYVYIDGKIRKFNGGVIDHFPCYISASDSIEDVAYEDFGDKPGRNVYDCQLTYSVPGIEIQSNGKAKRLEDAFFGKYALAHHSDSPRTIYDSVVFQDDVAIGKLTTNYAKIGELIAHVTEDQSVVLEKGQFKIVYSAGNIYDFFINSRKVYSVSSQGIQAYQSITTRNLQAGTLCIKENHLYESGTEADGSLNINILGANGGAQYFRDLNIGDGKGYTIFSIKGKSREAQLNGCLTLKNTSLEKEEQTLLNYIQWTDKMDALMGQVGYINTGNSDLYLTNVINGGGITIKSDIINLNGTLMINGENAKNLFVTSEIYNTNIANYIKKTDSIQIFVDHAGGGTAGQKKVCETIGAPHQEIVSAAFKEVANQLLDVGADTDWLDFESENVRGKARQVGHIVCVMGEVSGEPSAELFVSHSFQLPRGIAYPAYTVTQIYDEKNYCKVQIGGKLTHDETSASPGTYFNVTYLV